MYGGFCQAAKKSGRNNKVAVRQGFTVVCGFVANSLVLIFALIGHNTINIPEIFQVFTVFPVTL